MRTSPFHDLFSQLPDETSLLDGVAAANALVRSRGRSAIGLLDLSCMLNFGVKGPGAAEWITAAGVPVPSTENSYVPNGDLGFTARLGKEELFLSGCDEALLARLNQQLGFGTDTAYPVFRQDAQLMLWGRQANEVLLQTCSFNFESLERRAYTVVMTSMVGVSATVLPWLIEDELTYRIFCDPSYGIYLWETLAEIVQDACNGINVSQAVLRETSTLETSKR